MAEVIENVNAEIIEEDIMNTNEALEVKEDKVFSPAELEKIKEYALAIDLNDTNSIMNFGADAQTRLNEFSESALGNVRSKDLGAVGDSLSGLVTELKGFNALEEKKGLGKLFHKAANPIEQLKNKYAKAENNVNQIVNILDGHQITLTKDIATMDELFKANAENFKSLSLYIEAGKEKLKEASEITLPELKQKAELSGDANDLQAASDYQQMINRLEKKVHDLDLTKTVSLQMAPQIRMIQNNDALMIEKIQTAVNNTIPIWKSQMVLALGLANSEEALKAQKSVSDTTNELLKKNAEILKMTTVGIAEESERGIVDLETLQETNTKLIETIDDVMRIQKEGHEKRVQAEVELQRLEGDLKAKVLETIS